MTTEVCWESEELVWSQQQESEDLCASWCSQPLYPPLLHCPDDVLQVASRLTTPPLVGGLVSVLHSLGVHTVGQLSGLTRDLVHTLPIWTPKLYTITKLLREYEANLTMQKKKDDKKSQRSNDPKTEKVAQQDTDKEAATLPAPPQLQLSHCSIPDKGEMAALLLKLVQDQSALRKQVEGLGQERWHTLIVSLLSTMNTNDALLSISDYLFNLASENS